MHSTRAAIDLVCGKMSREHPKMDAVWLDPLKVRS
jgi:hypothetical protein